MSIRRLDDLISADTDVQVLKIDVEGFEEDVLGGADKLLSSGRVKYMLTECNTNIIGQERQNHYIRWGAG
jgi:FkbM family methyltransferase